MCTKCCQAKEVVPAAPDKTEQVKLDGELQSLLQSLPERKRRTFIRYMNKQKGKSEGEDGGELTKEDLQNKLTALKMNEEDDDDDFFDDESGEDDE